MSVPDEFTEEQKQYLQGFVSGQAAARAAQGLPPLFPQAGTGGGPAGPDASHHRAQDRYTAAGKQLVPEEKAKRERHPLDRWDEIVARAEAGRFPKGADVFCAKFFGLFYVAPAQDSYMCRLRLPNGILTAHQMRGVAELAERYGGGYSHVTTRANLQFREVGARHAPQVLMGLYELGIVNRGSGADNIRNVTGDPTAGIAAQELIDTRPLCREMHYYILNHREMYGLPRKFNIAFDGGGPVAVLEDTNDIGFSAVRVTDGKTLPAGVYFRVALGGITGHGDFARDLGIAIRAEQCVPVATAIVRVYIEHGDRTDRAKARMKYVIDRHGPEWYLTEVEKVLGAPLPRLAAYDCEPRPPLSRTAQIGVQRQKQDGLNYIMVNGLQNGRTVQDVIGGSITADLAAYGIKLPSAKNGLGVAFGVERRRERLALETDTSFQTNDLSGQGGPTIPVSGYLGVQEFFTEVRLPIVEGKPGADLLSLDASYRYSDYTTKKKTDTYGMGAEYAPGKAVRVRGSYQHAVRHANIVELFQPQGNNLFGMNEDPCGPAMTATAAQCAQSGLPAALYGSALLDSPAGQYQFLQGGNPTLEPEKADTWTIGLVLTPTRRLTATVDWWNIKIKGAIDNAPPDTILNQCLFQNNLCNLVQRDPSTGVLWFGAGRIVALNENLGGYETNGVDLQLNYLQPIGGMGSLGLHLVTTWVNKWEFEPIKGSGKFDCVGLYGSQCGTPNPEWRWKLRTTWQTPWNVDLAATWRHIDQVEIEGTSGNVLLNDPAPAQTDHVGPVTLQFADQAQHELGVAHRQGRGRLVHDDELGVDGGGAGDGDRLLLAARWTPPAPPVPPEVPRDHTRQPRRLR